jgi:hypothetical protein
MATITIDKKPFTVPPEVADLLMEVSEERDFYRKTLRWIAYSHIQGPGLDLQTTRGLAREAAQFYREK